MSPEISEQNFGAIIERALLAGGPDTEPDKELKVQEELPQGDCV